MPNTQEFRADHKGNCSFCHTSKRLDEMITKTENGYKCVDCVVDEESINIIGYDNADVLNDTRTIKDHDMIIPNTKMQKVIKKAMLWCFG